MFIEDGKRYILTDSPKFQHIVIVCDMIKYPMTMSV